MLKLGVELSRRSIPRKTPSSIVMLDLDVTTYANSQVGEWAVGIEGTEPPSFGKSRINWIAKDVRLLVWQGISGQAPTPVPPFSKTFKASECVTNTGWTRDGDAMVLSPDTSRMWLDDSGPRLTYSLEVPRGSYRVSVTAKGKDLKADSLWVSINGGVPVLYADFASRGSTIGKVVELEGAVTINVFGREDGIRVEGVKVEAVR